VFPRGQPLDEASGAAGQRSDAPLLTMDFVNPAELLPVERADRLVA
jgi:hypothetical protein